MIFSVHNTPYVEKESKNYCISFTYYYPKELKTRNDEKILEINEKKRSRKN